MKKWIALALICTILFVIPACAANEPITDLKAFEEQVFADYLKQYYPGTYPHERPTEVQRFRYYGTDNGYRIILLRCGSGVYFPAVENVLFCSSTGSYVPLQYFPADENHPWQQNTGLNFFHQCEWDMKALAECEAGRFPITILRPTNIIGETRVPLELWGGRNIEFYKILKEGRTLFIPRVRDVMVQSGYNWDLASAFVKALEKGDAVVGEIFNISCRKAITLGEFLNTAVSYLNSSSEIVELSDEDLQKAYPGKISMHYGLDFLKLHMCFDMRKAETILGYDPQVTAQEGLIRSLRWLEENGKL